jgi:hypothetical protein
MACIIFCTAAYCQTVPIDHTNPVAQLKNLLKLPGVGPSVINMPLKLSVTNNPELPEYTIAKNLAEAKLECPLLNPVPVIELGGIRENNENVDLSWETTNGFNNRAFDVERSLGDTLNFEKINFVFAEDQSAIHEKYKLPDANTYTEVSYYRLKLALTDGRYVYSNIAAVEGYGNFSFAIYPNPALHTLKISLSSKEEGNAAISIYDASGSMVLRQSTLVTEGKNLIDININKFSSGNYHIKMVLADKQVRVGKFIKN